MGNRKRQRYLSYLVFDQQKIRYYGIFDATYPLSDAELRLLNCGFIPKVNVDQGNTPQIILGGGKLFLVEEHIR